MSQSVSNGEPRFLALGDSYTIGEGVAAQDRWPAQLVRRLRDAGLALADADIVAMTGWTTDELLAAISAREFAPPYRLVTLQIGVNNQYRGRDLANYRAEFGALLEFAQHMAGTAPDRVLVISIPDWGVTRFAVEQGVDANRVSGEINQFNEINREMAAARGAHWVDVAGISRGLGRRLLADDGLHPAASQYALWVDKILPVADAMIRDQS